MELIFLGGTGTVTGFLGMPAMLRTGRPCLLTYIKPEAREQEGGVAQALD